MKYKRYLLIIVMIFTFFIGYYNVFAASSSNYNTSYTINLTDDYFTLEQKTFYKNIIDLDSSYYNLVINFYKNPYYTMNSFYLVPKNVSVLDVSVAGVYYNSSSFIFKIYGDNIKAYTFNAFDNQNVTYNRFINCYINNDCVAYTTPSSDNGSVSISFPVSNMTFDNNNSFIIPYSNYNSVGGFIYYSDVDLRYVSTYSPTSGRAYYKKLIFNDSIINLNYNIPTYLDLFPYDDENFDINKELDYYNSLSSFYFRINKSDISNFSFSYEFNPMTTLSLNITNPDYFDNFYDELNSEFKFFGRIYNSTDNYYTYESITCTLNHIYQKNSNSITSKGNNLSCSSDLSNYDYIFVYFRQFVNSINVSPSVIGLNTSVNGALYHYGNNFNGYIYDIFTNIPSNFKISFSSYYLDSALVLSSVENGAFAEYIGTTDNNSYIPMAQSNFPFRIAYGFSKSNYYVIYGDSSIYSGTRNIEVFIGDKTIISFNNTDNNNNFYIYDENKNISNISANVIYDINLNYGESYDLSYYFKQVDNYVNGLSIQIINFGNLTQNLYDNLPDFLQLFIFVSFILFCVYFTYRLIKK